MSGRVVGIVLVVGLLMIAGAWWFLSSVDAPPEQSSANNPAFVQLGEQVYAANCASCHGENGQGQANWRERKVDGKLPAPPLNGTGHTWHHPDDQLRMFITEGIAAIVTADYKSDMVGFGDKLSDREIDAAIAFIKTWWTDEVVARQQDITERSASSR